MSPAAVKPALGALGLADKSPPAHPAAGAPAPAGGEHAGTNVDDFLDFSACELSNFLADVN